MLMQNFKSAADLGITEPQLSALQKTLVLLETGKLVHLPTYNLGPLSKKFTGHFNMDAWNGETPCGTVACIGGTASLIGDVKFIDRPKELRALFYPDELDNWDLITPAQAATALRSYLTTGDARWDLAVASIQPSTDALQQDLLASLKRRAVDRCEGCRLNWRLDGWKHREPMPIECRAKDERRQLREISNALKSEKPTL